MWCDQASLSTTLAHWLSPFLPCSSHPQTDLLNCIMFIVHFYPVQINLKPNDKFETCFYTVLKVRIRFCSFLVHSCHSHIHVWVWFISFCLLVTQECFLLVAFKLFVIEDFIPLWPLVHGLFLLFGEIRVGLGLLGLLTSWFSSGISTANLKAEASEGAGEADLSFSWVSASGV